MKNNATIPNGFKETPIGILPEEWEILSLEKIVNKDEGIKRGPWGGSIKKEIFVSSGYKIYEQKNVIENNFAIGNYFINDNKFKELIGFKVEPGDILITAAGTIGKLAIVPKNIKTGIINQALIRIKLNKDKINKYYFEYIFNFLVHNRFLEGISHGATLKNLASVKVLKNIPIPIPPLPEQRKIAGILSAVQETKEKTESVIAAARALKKSLMKHLFTYGPIPKQEANTVSMQETEIGSVNSEWEIDKLNDYFEFTKKPRYLLIKDGEEIPFLPMNFIPEDKKSISNWQIKKLSEISSGTFVFKNDLIVAKITPCFENGKQAILKNLPKDYGYATTEVWALHPKKGNITTDYLYYFLKNPSVRQELASKMEGTTGRQRLPRRILANLLIPIPTLFVQHKITNMLSSVDEKIETEENKKKALDDLFKILLNNLMIGRIRVHNLEVAV